MPNYRVLKLYFVQYYHLHVLFLFETPNRHIQDYLVKGIQVKFFTVDRNVGKSLQCILTKFELSTSCRFQDIAVPS